MKRKTIYSSGLLATLLIAVTVTRVSAQTDPHFTQNYTFPMYINPALTGSSDGEYRASAVYRTQWSGITNPYRTMGISFDTRTNKNIALGINLLNQSAGDGGFNYLSTYGSFAYTGVKLGDDLNHRIVLALQAGIISRRVDPSKFKWGEQWNPITGYNASNPTTESFSNTSATSLDVGTGALYFDASPNKKQNAFGGISVFHINRPKDPIVAEQSDELNKIPMRYTLHGGVSFNLTEKTHIIPHALLMHQGSANELMLGAYAQHTINEETDVMIGAYYRVNDAVAPFFGVDYRDFVVGLSYDVNASKLGNLSRNVNSFELSLSYIKRKGGKSIFDFIRCARL